MDNSRALCAQHKHGRNGAGTDAFCLNVTHAYGWESAVVGLTRPEVKHVPLASGYTCYLT
jgi:hypothetical protein